MKERAQTKIRSGKKKIANVARKGSLSIYEHDLN
jgi:hypothetical protein